MEVKDLIHSKRLERGMTMKDLAKAVGVSEGTISRWESGEIENMRRDKVAKLSEVLGIPVEPLMGWKEKRHLPSNVSFPAARGVPILGTICCGDGIDDKCYDGLFFVDRTVKADYCVHIKGDSMRDAHIYDGDMAFIKSDYEFQDGKIYAVVIDYPQGEAVLKKVYRADGHLILQPCNEQYKPIVCKPEECLIVGELDGIYHKY